MNERIKELAQQAGIYFSEATVDYFGDKYPGFVSTIETDLEKFAELIVRECTSFIARRTNQAIDDDYNVDEAVSIAIIDLLESFAFKL